MSTDSNRSVALARAARHGRYRGGQRPRRPGSVGPAQGPSAFVVAQGGVPTSPPDEERLGIAATAAMATAHRPVCWITSAVTC